MSNTVESLPEIVQKPVPGSSRVSTLRLGDVVEILITLIFTIVGEDAFGDLAYCPPTCWWGGSGIAKTKVINAVTRALTIGGAGVAVLKPEPGASSIERTSWKCLVASPASRGAGFFGSTPVPFATERGMRIGYPAPEWFDSFPKGPDGRPYGLVFIDEITCVEPRLISFLLESLADRGFNGSYLPGSIRMVAAANPAALAANGYDLPASVANRLGHFAFPVDVEAWHTHLRDRARMLKDGEKPITEAIAALDTLAEQHRMQALYMPELQVETELLTRFTAAAHHHAYGQPDPSSPQSGGPWPSFRTCTMLVDTLAAMRVRHNKASHMAAAMRAFCGDGFEKDYAQFRIANDLPDIEKILAGTSDWVPSPSRMDVSHLVVRAASEKLIGENKLLNGGDRTEITQRAARVWRLLRTMQQTGNADLTVSVAMTLLAEGLKVAGDTVADEVTSRASGLRAKATQTAKTARKP